MLESENKEKYIWRLAQAKDSGNLDMSWDELAEVFNKEFGNEDEPLSEAAFRKPYQQAKRYFEAGVFSERNDDFYIKELQIQKDELFKEKRKLYLLLVKQ